MSNGTSRREFFRTVGRWTLVAAVGGIVARTMAMRGRRAPDGSGQPLALCERCPAVTSCQLPTGKLARRFFGKPQITSATDVAALCKVKRSEG